MNKSDIAKKLGVKTSDILTTAVYNDHISVILADFSKHTIPIKENTLPSAADTPRDKLRAIVGLGYTSQDRLYEAGIFTFARLIAQTPEKIKEITNQDLSLIERWQTDAVKFESGEWKT